MECDSRYSRHVAASRDARTASCLRDAVARLPAARLPGGAAPAGIVCGLVEHGLADLNAAVAVRGLAVGIDWPRGLAAVAGPGAAGLADAWLFAALVSVNCRAVVVAVCWSWPVAAACRRWLVVAAFVDPGVFVADLVDSLLAVGRAVAAASDRVESSVAAVVAVLAGVPALVGWQAFPGVSAQAWPVVPVSLIPPSGPDARKLARQIPRTETVLSY